MTSRVFINVAFLLLPGIVFGQATINSVTDAASFAPRVSPGSLASIFGSNLAASQASPSATPLPTNLNGTTVTINNTAVPLVYVSPTQINFQVPGKLTAGTASLVVQTSKGNSKAFSVLVLAEAPAIFQYGSNHAVAQNGDANATLNSDNAPAASGSVVTVYLTGQGPVNNAVADGAATPSSPLSKATATTTAKIGAQAATIEFLGLAPGFVGLAQANIQVPSLPTGDYPLVITINGIVSASAVLSVSGSGSFTAPLTLVGSASFANTRYSNVLLLGNTAYICGANRIVMVDVTTATQPTAIGEFGDSYLSGNGTFCALNNSAGIASPYIVDLVGAQGANMSLAVFDLTNPTSPTAVGLFTTTYPYIVDFSFSGMYAFATTSEITANASTKAITAQTGSFLSFSFASESQPQLIATVTPESGVAASSNQNLMPWAAVVGPTTVYVATTTATGTSTTGYGALNVIDISSPYTPNPVNQVTTSVAAILTSFDVSGTTLLAAGNTGGPRNPGNPDFDFTGSLTLTTMNIGTYDAPIVLANVNTGLQVDGTPRTAAFSNGVFAIVNAPPDTDDTGPASIMIVDARNPQQPLLYPSQTQFGFYGLVPTSTGYLLASTMNGLNIYQLTLQ